MTEPCTTRVCLKLSIAKYKQKNVLCSKPVLFQPSHTPDDQENRDFSKGKLKINGKNLIIKTYSKCIADLVSKVPTIYVDR